MHLDGNEGYLLIAHKPQKRYSGLKGGGEWKQGMRPELKFEAIRSE